MRTSFIPGLALSLLAIWGGCVPAQTRIELAPMPRGASDLIGSYLPRQAELSAVQPAGLKKLPELKAPLFGLLPVKSEGRSFFVVLDAPRGGPSRLFVDSNGNGDLSDDPAAEWEATAYPGGFTAYAGGAFLELRSGSDAFRAFFGMYRFDPADPSRAAYGKTLFYYRDYAYSGKAKIGGKAYDALLSDESASGDFTAQGTLLMLDRNGDGSFDDRWESFDAASPFALEGKSYLIQDLKPLGGRFTVASSKAKAREKLAPKELGKGGSALSFDATDLDGRKVSFPADYRGKIVLLDFWATWCGPCVQEIPGLTETYAAYAPKGFDILGISLDNAGSGEQLRSFLKAKGMTWRQVYDGGGWQAKIAALYSIQSIPSPFLVDGDSGAILAAGEELRGGNLRKSLEKALAAKQGK